MYRVVRCPNCAYLQVSGNSKSLKCLKCNKSKVISYLKIYFKSQNSNDCQLFISKMKEDNAIEKKTATNEFTSAL